MDDALSSNLQSSCQPNAGVISFHQASLSYSQDWELLAGGSSGPNVVTGSDFCLFW